MNINKKRPLDESNHQNYNNKSKDNPSISIFNQQKKIKIIKNALSQKESNRYTNLHHGPYIVNLVDNDPNSAIGNIHPMKIGKLLKNIFGHLLYLSRSSRNTYQITCNDGGVANDIVENQSKLNKQNWILFIPNFAINRIGIIRKVDINLTSEEIMEGMEPILNDTIAPINIERLTRWDEKNGCPIPTSTIKVTFLGNNLPNQVYIWCVKSKVDPYVDRVRLCMNCHRFGHSLIQCRSQKRCGICAGDHHEENCSSDIICGNCSGPHKSLDKRCPAFHFHQIIKHVMAYANVSSRKARDIIKNHNIQSTAEVENIFQTKEQYSSLNEWIINRVRKKSFNQPKENSVNYTVENNKLSSYPPPNLEKLNKPPPNNRENPRVSNSPCLIADTNKNSSALDSTVTPLPDKCSHSKEEDTSLLNLDQSQELLYSGSQVRTYTSNSDKSTALHLPSTSSSLICSNNQSNLA